MGFKDLYSFILAMLAWKGWRLIQSLESLHSQVLRAKYSLDGNLLDAKPMEDMSYVCRSILKGLELFKEGVI
jgi:hypothetical protein